MQALFLLAALVAIGVAVALFARRRAPQAVGALIMGVLSLIYYLSADEVDNRLVFITPYLVTLLVLAFASQHLRPPAAEGKPWRKGDIA